MALTSILALGSLLTPTHPLLFFGLRQNVKKPIHIDPLLPSYMHVLLRKTWCFLFEQHSDETDKRRGIASSSLDACSPQLKCCSTLYSVVTYLLLYCCSNIRRWYTKRKKSNSRVTTLVIGEVSFSYSDVIMLHTNLIQILEISTLKKNICVSFCSEFSGAGENYENTMCAFKRYVLHFTTRFYRF